MSRRAERGSGPSGGVLATVAAALAVLTGALVLYHLELDELSHRAGALAEAAEMASLEDGLTGATLPRLAAGSELRVVWAVDLSRCAECLGDLAGWRRLEGLAGVERRAVLLGAEAPARRRAARRTGLSSDLAGEPGETALRELLEGSAAASLALLLDDRGRVLAADARDARTACTSDPVARFAELVAGLRRAHDSREPTHTRRSP